MSSLVKISLALFVAAELAIFALIGVDSLPLVGVWAVVALVVGVCGWLVRGTSPAVVGAALLILACLFCFSLLGVFFLPSAIVLLVSAVQARRKGQSAPQATSYHA
jgi:hypothetical protein